MDCISKTVRVLWHCGRRLITSRTSVVLVCCGGISWASGMLGYCIRFLSAAMELFGSCRDQRIRTSVIILANLPVSIVVPFVGVDVPSARARRLDSYDLTSILQGALDVEILLVVRVPERPAIAGVLNLPLHEKVRTPC